MNHQPSILYLPIVTSTQEIALQWVKEGDRQYDLVYADHQTAGRGRQGETWRDEPGNSLLASYVLWDVLLPEPVGVIGMVMAVAALRAIEGLWGERSAGAVPPALLLKYPNDLILQNKKLGGILVEVTQSRQKESVAVVGVGINLGQTRFPPELERIAISLRQAVGALPSTPSELRDRLAIRIFEQFHTIYTEFQHDPSSLLRVWRERDGTTGRAYRVLDLPGQPIGTALQIEPDFSLRLSLPDGTQHCTYWVGSRG